MRWSFVVLAIVLVPAIALAKPKLAVAPLDGDKDGAVADVIAEEASEHGKTTKPDKVAREMEKLELSAVSAKSAKKLRSKLEVDVLIHGKLDKDGGKKHLELVVSGKSNRTFDVDFRTTKDLKKALASRLGASIESAVSGKGGDGREDGDDSDKRKDRDDDSRSSRGDDDDKHSPFSGKSDDDDDKRSSRDDDKRKDRDDDKR
ncbi:MAG TPA: hypothetical protein VL326_12160, partial [Kofleriaceae bacterium]|nr:hypothetical protein [Kofleriaceae bacterium]